ncbi:MAG: type II toxin-antitoxin system VapC family toxin [Chloroflexi bacterium]|nr:type II toxin-antitoxin system VapC family toxin [Chloroflexota bacterium]
MLYLLNTNAVSDLMREDPAVDARLAAASPDDAVVICTVVRGEILYGLERLAPGQRRRELENKAAALFAILPCEPVPEAAADHYAQVKLSRQKNGLALDENDLWIAATARAIGAALVSRDSDFRQIDFLAVEDWTQ